MSDNIDNTDLTIKEFIKHIITFDDIDSILNTYKSQSIKGYIFERIYDIIIKFGFCDVFKNSDYIHLIGNSNNGKLKQLKNFNKYLNEKIISGNSGGCSDISLQNKLDGTYIFITSKYPKTSDEIKKQKSVIYYEIQNIVAMTEHNKHIYKNSKICLLAPDKIKILNKVKKANITSNYITKHMTEENIFDKNDLNRYFLAFKQDIIKNINENWTELYFTSKEDLKLRFHQELSSQKISDSINKGLLSFLLGCKCRSGKTYMVGGIIIKQINIKKKLNVLIITPAPTETAPQFTDDLFNKFKDFRDFKIHHVQGSESLKNMALSKNNIIVLSKQLLQKYINDETIMEIKNLNLDIIFFDENHYSGTTDLSKEILKSYGSKNTSKVYLTATYNKPLKEWNIIPECQIFWDIEDEQICKQIYKSNPTNPTNPTNPINPTNSINQIESSNLLKLKEKHGEEYITKTIKYYTNLGLSINDIFKPYEKMPELHIITNMLDSERYNAIKEKLNKENKIGFCFETLFGLNKLKTQFSFENEVKTILRYISGSQKETDGEKTLFPRINKICSEKESRIPFTQIWFLPSNNINETSVCLKKIMLEDNILKRYEILCINSNNKNLAKDIKDEINKKEIEAKSKGLLGIILLAGNMLTLGITLNLCDVVILLNNVLSSDKVLQQMYRCMTEGENKKIGFVVDLNISRVLNTCINHTIYKNTKNIDEKMKYLIENHLINIDVDMLDNKKINSDTIIKKLLDIWKSDPLNSYKTLMHNLENDIVEFDNTTQKSINNYFMKSIKNNNFNVKIQLKDANDELQILPTGKEIIKLDNTKNNTKDSEDSENNTEELENIKTTQTISLIKDVLPDIIPLACILTIHNKNMDFVKMLTDIKNNPELLDTFDDHCTILYSRKDLINFIKDIIEKFFDKSANIYSVTMQFKMSLHSLLNNPKELLELISECLKPKTIEKKTFGEVFTPMNFINDKMLKDIEDYWITKHKENIWSNEKLTWYDPASGMGNYPIAIYYKLLEGLKIKIPDEKKRKKHIIEKQLFMGELNKKNCFIIKQIFNINNKYKLNLYEGDTLKININETFNVSNFDIIIGNPPYNEELKGFGAKPLYNKFIEYYINKCNLLSFIVPSRWFAGGKGLDKFREMMINRTDILYIKHYDNANKIFDKLVNIEGGVNYFLIDKNYNGLCDYNKIKIKLNSFDIILDNKYYNIVNKFIEYPKITNLYLGRYFGIESNDKNLLNDIQLIKCYVSQQKGFTKYIDKKFVKKEYNFFKIITARANGGNGCFGNIFIGNNLEIHTGSYISFKVSNENEAKSLLSYLKCKLPNFMLSLRKISQDISESTCKWIPLPPLNKEWNDEKIYKYFKLTIDEIKLINETKIIGYKDLVSNNNK